MTEGRAVEVVPVSPAVQVVVRAVGAGIRGLRPRECGGADRIRCVGQPVGVIVRAVVARQVLVEAAFVLALWVPVAAGVQHVAPTVAVIVDPVSAGGDLFHHVEAGGAVGVHGVDKEVAVVVLQVVAEEKRGDTPFIVREGVGPTAWVKQEVHPTIPIVVESVSTSRGLFGRIRPVFAVGVQLVGESIAVVVQGVVAGCRARVGLVVVERGQATRIVEIGPAVTIPVVPIRAGALLLIVLSVRALVVTLVGGTIGVVVDVVITLQRAAVGFGVVRPSRAAWVREVGPTVAVVVSPVGAAGGLGGVRRVGTVGIRTIGHTVTVIIETVAARTEIRRAPFVFVGSVRAARVRQVDPEVGVVVLAVLASVLLRGVQSGRAPGVVGVRQAVPVVIDPVVAVADGEVGLLVVQRAGAARIVPIDPSVQIAVQAIRAGLDLTDIGPADAPSILGIHLAVRVVVDPVAAVGWAALGFAVVGAV